MISTLTIVTLLAEAAEGTGNREQQAERAADASPIVISVPKGTMSCKKEGDHLTCIVPLQNETLDELKSVQASTPKALPYKRSSPTPALPDPQVLNQLKAAQKNIDLAKSLLPRATTPEEAVFAEQLLYWAKEQYRTTEALLHTEKEDLVKATDPFEGQGSSAPSPSL